MNGRLSIRLTGKIEDVIPASEHIVFELHKYCEVVIFQDFMNDAGDCMMRFFEVDLLEDVGDDNL